MLDANSIKDQLNHFIGGGEYHKWSFLYPRFYLTEGAKFLADSAECYWLMDIIGSYQKKLLKRDEFFQVWKLCVHNSVGKVTCGDGSDKRLVTQQIPWTDFPMGEVKLYAQWNGEQLVIMLPQEY